MNREFSQDMPRGCSPIDSRPTVHFRHCGGAHELQDPGGSSPGGPGIRSALGC